MNFSYDQTTGWLATTTFDRGTTSLGYYSDGQLHTITTPEGNVVSYGYNGPLVTSEAWSGAVSGSESWSYNNDLLVGTQTVDGSTTTYGYDNDGLITSLAVGSGSMTLTPDPTTGQLDGTTAGAVNDGYTYYPDGSIHHYTATGPSGALYDLDYTRDTLDRVTVKKETLAGTTHTYAYTYWPDGELWQVYRDKLNSTGDGPPTDPSVVADVTYTYDANGNRSSRTLADSSSSTAIVDAQDRLTGYGLYTYTYDDKGSLATKSDNSQPSLPPTKYTYDELGNLTHVEKPDGTTIDYIIDGENRRVAKQVNGVITDTYFYDGLGRLVQWTDANDGQALFVYAEHSNVPSYMYRAGNDYRIITDQLGSPRLVVWTNNPYDNEVVEEIDYDEFGNVTRDTSPGFIPFGFAGGLYDQDTGLVRFGARDYDPQSGRWTAKDPILFAGGETSLYGYAGEDPQNGTDPSGLLVVAGDRAGLELLQSLSSYPEGDELLMYLQFSPITYTVYGSAPMSGGPEGTVPPAGMFGRYQCPGAAPEDQIVRVLDSPLICMGRRYPRLGMSLAMLLSMITST